MALNSLSTAPTEKFDSQLLDECIIAVAEGDMDSLQKLYYMTYKSVYGYALSIVGNIYDAEDVLQDVYIQIHSKAGKYSSLGKPLAWIFTITKNLSLMHLRKTQHETAIPPDELTEQLSGLCEVTPEDSAILDSVMQNLKSDERQIVMLHALTGMKHREIAEIMGLSLSAVLSKYTRSLKKLRESLTEAV